MMEKTPHGMVGRRAVLATAGAVPIVAAGATLAPRAASADPATEGEWSAPFNLGGVAIHATLMHNDEVLLFQDVEGNPNTDFTSLVVTWNWRTGAVRQAPLTYNRDLFCTHHNVLADGRVYTAGGHDYTTGQRQSAVGAEECDIYDPIARTWTPTANLAQKRWYPTQVGLPNGKVLIFGGTSINGIASALVEEFTPSTGVMRSLPSSATKVVGMYPHMFLLADGRIVRTGPAATTNTFNPATNRWANVTSMIQGKRTHGTAVLLPGAQKVLAAGGSGPNNTAEILDMSVSSPRWRSVGRMNYARILSNSVVLPDGQVLTIGGGRVFKYSNPVKVPEMFNPATETWTPMAPQQAGRMYHGTALLLPDARVLSAGQDYGTLARQGEIFSPPYLFRGARPTVTGAPTNVSAGGTLRFDTNQASSMGKVVLIRPGSNTHEIDSDQRSVPLSFTVSGTRVTAQVPTNRNLLPPGYYMMFAVNTNGVPSVAPWVHVD